MGAAKHWYARIASQCQYTRHRHICLKLSHCAELLALRRGTCKGAMELAALLLLFACFGVTSWGQGDVGSGTGSGLPLAGASFARAPCSSTPHHEILVPPDACDLYCMLCCMRLRLCWSSQEG